MQLLNKVDELVAPIRDDLTSGAAELALRAITIFQTVLADGRRLAPEQMRVRLAETSRALTAAQPAMAPIFHLCNQVLLAADLVSSTKEIAVFVTNTLSEFEKRLCSSAEAIANHVFNLIPAGELVFAYSFSSTVVSSLLNARSKGKLFRVVCTESRPAMEGRKLAATLAGGGIEVIHTFDTALGLLLSECRAAFMGADVIGKPGLVNKVGSFPLAVTCRELRVPLYSLAGTEKFALEDQLFEFENHSRPPEEVWTDAPDGVRILNHQFELVPFSLITGLVTEEGVLKEAQVDKNLSNIIVHHALKLSSVSCV